jgi:hypothetical protein
LVAPHLYQLLWPKMRAIDVVTQSIALGLRTSRIPRRLIFMNEILSELAYRVMGHRYVLTSSGALKMRTTHDCF